MESGHVLRRFLICCGNSPATLMQQKFCKCDVSCKRLNFDEFGFFLRNKLSYIKFAEESELIRCARNQRLRALAKADACLLRRP